MEFIQTGRNHPCPTFSLFAVMLALFGSSICGFATVKLDPLCEACKLDGEKHIIRGTTKVWGCSLGGTKPSIPPGKRS